MGVRAEPAVSILARRAAEGGRVHVRLRLRCGCVYEGEIAADRLVEAMDGQIIAVGKYRCPRDHPTT